MQSQQVIIRPDGDKSIMDAVSRKEMQSAIKSLLPNGENMSDTKAAALVTVAMTSGRDPFMREVHATDLGLIDAAKSRMADFNDWLDRRGDAIERWSEERIIHGGESNTARRKELGAEDPRDVVMHVRLHLRSTRKAWQEQGAAMVAMGAPYTDIVAAIGREPAPAAEAYGIVHFAEQKDTNKSTAAQKWAEMDSKYSRVERASKRARDLIINKYLPTTTEIRKRSQLGWVERMASAMDDPTKQITSRGEVVPAGAPTTTAQRQQMLGRRQDDDSLLDDNAPARVADIIAANQTPAVIEGEATQLDMDGNVMHEPAPSQDWPVCAVCHEETASHGDLCDNCHALDQRATGTAGGANEVALPPALLEMRLLIQDKAGFFSGKNWTPSAKQSGFTASLLRSACRKDERLYRATLHVLAGQTHWGNVGPFEQYAILKAFLKDKPKGATDEIDHPSLQTNLAMIRNWMATQPSTSFTE